MLRRLASPTAEGCPFVELVAYELRRLCLSGTHFGPRLSADAGTTIHLHQSLCPAHRMLLTQGPFCIQLSGCQLCESMHRGFG